MAAMAAALVLALTLAGCGSDGDGGSGEGAGAEEGAFPVTIEHRFGSTEITAAPQRVVTVGLSDIDPVLALGVIPVGVTDWYGDYANAAWPWAQEALGDATVEVMPRNNDQVDIEKVVALNPDLILGLYSGMTRQEYERLSQIAPTIAPSGDHPAFGTPWQEMTRTAGAALGRPQLAEELIAGVEARFAAAREEHPELGGKSAVVGERFDTYFVRSATDPRTRFLTELGFELPQEIADLAGDRDGAPISDERLDLLDRDLLLWNIGFVPEAEDALADNRLYQGLRVAREGRDLFLTDQVLSGALTFSTVLSIPYAIDGLVPQLPAVVDGDPATEPKPAEATG
jgi:iron complex transport system substrate-binding protein